MKQIKGLVTKQVGWRKCIACSDSFNSRAHRGQMWVKGDTYITCVECNGTCQVPVYDYCDMRTGERIDPEKIGRTVAAF